MRERHRLLRWLFYLAVVAMIWVVWLVTSSLPSFEWHLYPVFGVALAGIVLEWVFFWRPIEHDELRERRRSVGRCPECGYDLSGNVSGACPECGIAVSRREQSRAHQFLP